MNTVRIVRAAGLLALCVCAVSGAARAQESQPAPGGQARPRDAAEAVQEGSVTQWLQHYQRERGEEWAKSKPGPPAVADPPAQQPPPVGTPGADAPSK